MQQAVVNLGSAEAGRILEDQGFIEVSCEFCGRVCKYEGEMNTSFL
jgi:redox-regulated HSP33 family molecular chaperone